MVDLKEKQVEKIKSAKSTKSVEVIIDTVIFEMNKEGIEHHRILDFIRWLDIALLMIDRRELTDRQWENTEYAKKILINKIMNESGKDLKKLINKKHDTLPGNNS